MDDAERLRKAETAASVARAQADVAQANASLARAQIEASGKRIAYDWETGTTTVVPIPKADSTSRGSSVSGRRRGSVK